jgi:hypothetical protein
VAQSVRWWVSTGKRSRSFINWQNKSTTLARGLGGVNDHVTRRDQRFDFIIWHEQCRADCDKTSATSNLAEPRVSNSPMSAFLDLYDSLDIIGNGSFGIIRKVRRKADGMVSTSCHSVNRTRDNLYQRSLRGRNSTLSVCQNEIENRSSQKCTCLTVASLQPADCVFASETF